MIVFLDKSTYIYQYRQRERVLWNRILFLGSFDFAEILDWFVGKIRKKKESKRRNEKRFQYFRKDCFVLNKNFDFVNLHEEIFQFIRCWVKPYDDFGQRLMFGRHLMSLFRKNKLIKCRFFISEQMKKPEH